MHSQYFLPITTPADVTPDLAGRVIVATGHRPQSLPGGYRPEAAESLLRFATSWLKALRPRLVVSGMAQGWDQAVAAAAARLTIPFHATIPCDDFHSRWPQAAQRTYQELRSLAADEKIVCPGRYHAGVNQARNVYMIDLAAREAGLLLALWNGTPGGTLNTLDYSLRHQLARLNTWEDFRRHTAA